ncbi:hypothetical protein Tco_0738426 [Tanacetum coccineum]
MSTPSSSTATSTTPLLPPRPTRLQALVDGKKVIITETSVRRDLKLKDAEGIECLPNADIFAQLTLMGKEGQELTGSEDYVVSFDDKGLGDQEDASKQGRKIADIDADTEVTLVDDIVETQGSTADPLQLTGEVVTTANVEVTTDSATTTTVDELTLAQTLIEIKAAKPKDKGKGKMIELEMPLKKKYQIMYDQEIALNLQAQLQAELEEEERLAKKSEEDANITEWDDVQVLMDVDYELATRLQAEEQGVLTAEEKSKLFIELMHMRKKHFLRLKAKEQRRKPLTKAQKRNQMCTYLKNMDVYKQNTEFLKESSKKAEAEMAQEKEDDEIVDATPLSVKIIIVDYKIHKKGKLGSYKIIRADGSSKIYLLFSQLIKSFDRADLETLWKLVKAKHGNTRPEEGYERVLWGNLKTMFEHHIEDLVWRNLQGKTILVWRLYDSCGIHIVRFEYMHVYMLVEKRYPLTPATIIAQEIVKCLEASS